MMIQLLDSPRIASDILHRCAAWLLFLTVFLLSSPDVIEMLPDSYLRLVYLAMTDLLAIVVWMRMPDSPIARDMIDISLYDLAFYSVAVTVAFFNKPVYAWMGANLAHRLPAYFFIVAVIRVFWPFRNSERTAFVNWPPLGVYGLLKQRQTSLALPSGRQLALICAALLAAIPLAIGTTYLPLGWTKVLVGGVTAIMLLLFVRQIIDSLIQIIADKLEDKMTISWLKGIMIEAMDEVAAMKVEHSNRIKEQVADTKLDKATAAALLLEILAPRQLEILTTFASIRPEVQEEVFQYMLEKAADNPFPPLKSVPDEEKP